MSKNAFFTAVFQLEQQCLYWSRPTEPRYQLKPAARISTSEKSAPVCFRGINGRKCVTLFSVFQFRNTFEGFLFVLQVRRLHRTVLYLILFVSISWVI